MEFEQSYTEDDVKDIFRAWDLNENGFIDRKELACCCSELNLSEEQLNRLFAELDVDGDNKISLDDFSKGFQSVCSLFHKDVEPTANGEIKETRKFEKLLEEVELRGLLSGQEYISDLFHYLHNSADSPQVLALLEGFLFSVIRDVKHFSSENQRLEDALKRTCEKHTEHMDQLDNELEQQMQRLEARVRKEEKSKQERSNVDLVWQLENKNKEIQNLNARVQKLEGRLKRKEPEEQKIKEEVDEKVQEIRFLRSQLTDAQTNLAVLRSELAQMRNDYEEQEAQLEAEKRTVMECVQEQESLTRQLQLLHEANKKLHDTNDDLRSALEARRVQDRRSPSPNKRHSISTLYSPTSTFTRNTKSPVNSRHSPGLGESLADSVDGRSGQTTPSRMFPVSAPLSAANSRRGSLLPSQQSCEVDDESIVNENSLMTELMQVHQLSVPEEVAEQEQQGEGELDYNNNAGILNGREVGLIHHLIPPARQTCEVDDPIDSDDKLLLDEPVIQDKRITATDTTPMTSDDTERSDKDSDKLLRNRSSSRFSAKFGKYFGKLGKSGKEKEESSEVTKDGKNLMKNSEIKKADVASIKKDADLRNRDARKVKNYSKRKSDNDRNIKVPNGAQDKIQTAKETKTRKSKNIEHGKTRLIVREVDSESVPKQKDAKSGSRDKGGFGDGGVQNRAKKNPSVTFSPTVTCTSNNNTRGDYTLKASNVTKGLTIPHKQTALLVVGSETSDTDSTCTTQELQTNFHHELADEDEAYNSMRSSERQTITKQLDILQETNKRLCESNDDLRAALEALTGRRSLSLKAKSKKNGEKCQRNPSVHSDYGSISSRSITPNHFQGPKSEDDVGDGAEADELSGYDPESDVTTMTINTRHFEAAPKLSKLTATANKRHVTLPERANDVMWESDTEHEPDPPQAAAEQGDVETNSNRQSQPAQSPFDRNSNLRKPCRHKSLEQLFNKTRSKGDRSTWPSIARAGKWNSMEQVRRSGDFIGQRTRSLPTSRLQSDQGPNFGKGVGFWQLSEKLDALRSSQEKVAEIRDDNRTKFLSSSHSPVATVIQNLNTEIETVRPEFLNRLIRQPAHAQNDQQSSPNEEAVKERLLRDEENRLIPVNHTLTSGLRRTNSLVIKRNRVKTDSLPESESGKPDAQLSAELEAQFKSVIEEDDEDIDEDDVRDEELAELVAMASALSESEEETDTETEAPEGERGAAVGSDSTSEASTNTPLNVSSADASVPERMYKLVLAGDAAVGKSSFILRLCRNKFHNALNSTLGVDFQMKTICVDGKTIALQLWDTAGQERFRSIAKSYFRKADGVLLLYDVTCETSFLDVRDWVEAIEESTLKPIPIMLCGNKTDLRQSHIDEGKTVIAQESGEKLAKEYGALFIETSTKENKNITEACIELGRLLRRIEDTEVEESNGLKLTEGVDSKNKMKPNCCRT